MKHKWYKEICAWANGAEIEFKDINENWRFDSNPFWNGDSLEFRIKPQPIPKGFPCNNSPTGIKEPQYLYVYRTPIREDGCADFEAKLSRVKIGLDNYIGKIKLEDSE
jgi:hypothetical protein